MAESKDGAKLMIVDTDVGIDDACALILLLGKHQRPVSLLAITTVRGNVGVDQVCSNVLRVLKVTDRLDVSLHCHSYAITLSVSNIYNVLLTNLPL